MTQKKPGKATGNSGRLFSCDILDNYRTIVEEYCKVADVLLRVI